MTIAEAHRVQRPDGELTGGFIDRESGLRQTCFEHQAEDAFDREALVFSGAAT